CLQGYRPPYSF
nr:immunoglobulin light chain junction region [Macaca mulatta]MPN86705.1 immunoglobulin light chain junction region [Macaca mulatta]MPN86726.1 immunoglobulin light chain junction region [Macaca mulatta]MPN86750.1 immunoglobulin light chain junction region [Macaca mulatta]MPN86841.1 immunoglobulin light chain junction region [Macaca mulatta]